MDLDLEKVDAVRERTGVSYRDAKEALEKTNGDVLEAIVYLEEKGDSWSSWTNNIGSKGEDLLEKLKQILKEGNVNKITVKKDGEIIMNIPINAGAIGMIASPFLATVGITAAVLTKCTIEITKKDGEIITLGEVYKKAAGKVKENIKGKDDK